MADTAWKTVSRPALRAFLLLILVLVGLSHPIYASDATSYMENEAEITVRNLQVGSLAGDSYRFELLPVKGWSSESASTFSSGQTLKASELPMPEGTDPSSGTKVIEIPGDVEEGTCTLGRIRIESPGWYMYQVREVIPAVRKAGIRYDETSYYIVVYAKNGDMGAAVTNVTAWHNNKDSSKDLPDLSDITSIPDTDSELQSPGQKVFGKVANGEHAIEVAFWNTIEKSTLIVRKNVRGSLGDRTKQFKFRLTISGLTPSTEFAAICDGVGIDSGLNENYSFVSDKKGKAIMEFYLSDDTSIEFENLTAGAKYNVIEGACNHVASYEVRERGEVVASGENRTMYTPMVVPVRELKSGVTTEVIYQNDRNITTVTGVNDNSKPYAVLMMISLVMCLAIAVMGSPIRRGDAE